MIALLITCSVVVYLRSSGRERGEEEVWVVRRLRSNASRLAYVLSLHTLSYSSWIFVCLPAPIPRSTKLYFMYIGPVYIRAATCSSTITVAWPGDVGL